MQVSSCIDTLDVNLEDPQASMYFWDELASLDYKKLKFSPFGGGTLEIPKFHRENYQKLSLLAETSDFQYSNYRGSQILIKSIAKNMQNFYSLKINPDENIIVCDGANKTASAIIDAHCEKGEEILIFEPYYTTHFLIMNKNRDYKIRLCQFDLISNLNGEKEWRFNLENFKNAMRDTVKVIIIINPNNPVTCIFSQENMEQISQVLENYPQTVVIEDNAYFAYVMPGSEPPCNFSAIANNFEKTYNVYSAGKLFNAHGMRVGWAISSKILIEKVEKIRYGNFNFVSSIEQLVCAKNLEDMYNPYKSYRNYFEYLTCVNTEKINKLKDILRKYDILPLTTMGTYYINVDISKIVKKIPEEFFYHLVTKQRIQEYDKAFCRWMLKYEIGFLPLSVTTKNPEKFDTILRIPANRTDEDFNNIQEALGMMLDKYI